MTYVKTSHTKIEGLIEAVAAGSAVTGGLTTPEGWFVDIEGHGRKAFFADDEETGRLELLIGVDGYDGGDCGYIAIPSRHFDEINATVPGEWSVSVDTPTFKFWARVEVRQADPRAADVRRGRPDTLEQVL